MIAHPDHLVNLRLNRRDALRVSAAALAAGRLSSLSGAGNPLKARWVNHYIYLTQDLKKTTDWYYEVFNMQMGIRSAKEAHMWFSDGDNHTCVIVRQAEASEKGTKIVNFAFTL